VVRTFDLGDVDLGPVPATQGADRFRAPVRGLLVTPRGSRHPARLVVVAHLRYPNCGRDRFAFPCANAPERRFDRGMLYLGVALARRGYSVLIPDLAPLYVGHDLDAPYDQSAGFTETVSRMLVTLRLADAGERTRFGRGVRGRIDLSRIGLVAHSRSASATRDFVRAWSEPWSRVGSVMVYGGAHQIEFHGRKGTFPAMPDLPFLGVVGDQDRDVGFMGSMWLSHHIDQRRRRPALMAVVPGLGHTYVNRALSAKGIDDRICDGDCPSARAHERFLVSTAQRWFDTPLRHERSDFPMLGMSALPDRLSGLPVRWLAVTNGPRRIAYLAGRTGTFRAFGPSGHTRTCYPLEELAPIQRGDCPLPARAVTQNAAAVTQVRLAPRSGVWLGTLPTTGVSGIVLQLSPSDDRTDRHTGNPVVVVVHFAGGTRVRLHVRGDTPALADRATAKATGVYTTSTVRVALPRRLRTRTIVALTLRGEHTVSKLDIRGIDLAQQVVRFVAQLALPSSSMGFPEEAPTTSTPHRSAADHGTLRPALRAVASCRGAGRCRAAAGLSRR
jgi:hypothetical protein